MEKKLFTIECENVALVVRPNGDTVIVTEATELVLNNAVMEQIVRNSGAYKSFVATKDEVVKHFGDFVAIMEIDINNYKNGKLAIKARLINDFKDKVRSNFEKGSSNYQYMISNYFTKLLGSKNSDECLRIYNMAMMEIKLFTMDSFRVKER